MNYMRLIGITIYNHCLFIKEDGRRFLKRTALLLMAVFALPGTIPVVALAGEILSSAPIYDYKIVNVYPHDQSAFTQGLIYEDGFLYEGTGLYGKSELRKTVLETGKVLKSHRLSSQYFGEGITIWKNEIVQLTWREKKGFVYGKETFDLIREFSYPAEGWGLTHDDKRLIMSDGSSYLYFLDPETFEQIGHLDVHDGDLPISNLNELEYVRGRIYANVWPTNRIAIISPETGAVEAWLDLSGLKRDSGFSRRANALNGIAYDSEHDRLFVTGKLWPKLFEIKVVPAR